MRNKLLLAILVFMLTGLVNAFAAIPTKSQIYPLNGTIVNTVQQVCNADVSSPVPSGVPSTIFKNEIVQATFVPEPTLGFNAWVASLTAKSIASPISQIGITQDPTSSAPFMLVETPIQWGQSIGQNTNIHSNAPYSTTPVLFINSHTNLTVLTTFTYSVSANNNNFKSGYALYSFSPGDTKWSRLAIYFNPLNSTTQAFTSAAALNGHTETKNFGGVNYNYDCSVTLHMTH